MADLSDDERPGAVGEGPASGRDPAKAKFYFIAAQRIAGVVLVILGIMAMEGRLDWGEGVGAVLAVVGLIDFFLVPLLLARLWKSPGQDPRPRR
jgi:hypothetical protein